MNSDTSQEILPCDTKRSGPSSSMSKLILKSSSTNNNSSRQNRVNMVSKAIMKIKPKLSMVAQAVEEAFLLSAGRDSSGSGITGGDTIETLPK